MKRAYVLSPILLALIFSSASARILRVPDQFPTIQAGIDSSANGDTVLVAPGIYIENINYGGRNIVLSSHFIITHDASFIESTIIDGDSLDAAVTFNSGETADAIIMGFTIRRAFGQYGNKGGIYGYHANPTIQYNYIIDNYTSGIFIGGSSSLIKGNYIARNKAIYGGGGISCALQGQPRIENNVIADNSCDYNGGGIYCQDDTATIINNTIAGNYCGYYGGGIYLNFAPNGNTIVTLINSICWSNNSLDSSQIYLRSGPAYITVSYSDIQGGWQGTGNLDIGPAFRDTITGNYRLMSLSCGYGGDSPCIDAGDPSTTDELLDCQYGLGNYRADMGAYGGGNFYMPNSTDDDNFNTKPVNFSLSQNYPNPFNPATTIKYDLPIPCHVGIDIYDILGRRVANLVDEEQVAGAHQAIWNAGDKTSGVYFYRIQAGEIIETKKMMLMK